MGEVNEAAVSLPVPDREILSEVLRQGGMTWGPTTCLGRPMSHPASLGAE
jgi:hypothetical protein